MEQFNVVESSLIRDAVEQLFDKIIDNAKPYWKDLKQSIIRKVIANTEIPKD